MKSNLNEEEIRINYMLMSLRGCFYAGYTIPQYCIDHKYKKPLIIGNDSDFLWEIYVQFSYDRRIEPQFCTLEKEEKKDYSANTHTTQPLNILSLDSVNNFARFDTILIFLPQYTVDKYCDGTSQATETIISFLSDFLIQYRRKIKYLDTVLVEISSFVYGERPILNYHKHHPEVKIAFMDYPIMCQHHPILSNPSRLRSLSDRLSSNIQPMSEEYMPFDELGYTRDETLRLLKVGGVEKKRDGSTILIDNSDPLWRISNGIRETAFQEGNAYKNTFWCLGNCVLMGYTAPYDKTFESYLQNIFNRERISYRVVNASQTYARRFLDLFQNLEKLPVKEGDIILFCIDGVTSCNSFPFFKARELFRNIAPQEKYFSDRVHINERGFEILAKNFYQWLHNSNFFNSYNYIGKEFIFDSYQYYGILNKEERYNSWHEKYFSYEDELNRYKNFLSEQKLNVGCIVMNANPFTLGHKYLVEFAVKKCTHLYLFVVEEDKSYFSFKDRFEMVKRGCKGIDNITIIPSGKFVLSSLTFKDYFNKEILQNKTVDPIEDVELFAAEIAPILGITVRFAGEEPSDGVTLQYNETMKKILPKYGIAFKEIPRLKISDEIVSASSVRKFIESKDVDGLKRIVPHTTFTYLQTIGMVGDAV